MIMLHKNFQGGEFLLIGNKLDKTSADYAFIMAFRSLWWVSLCEIP